MPIGVAPNPFSLCPNALGLTALCVHHLQKLQHFFDKVDVLVENRIILELKSVDELKGIHEAQLLTYMKLAGIKQGFLINFNVRMLKQGLKSFVL